MNLSQGYVTDNCIIFHIPVVLEYFTRKKKEGAEYYVWYVFLCKKGKIRGLPG